MRAALLFGLVQALVHCPHLSKIVITDCPQLETVMLWSNELSELDMSGEQRGRQAQAARWREGGREGAHVHAFPC